MIFVTYMNEILRKIEDDNFPVEVKLDTIVFLFVALATICILNILFYIIANIFLN